MLSAHVLNRRAALAALAGALVPTLAFSGEPMRPVEREAIAAYLNTLDPGVMSPKKLIIEEVTADTGFAFVGVDGAERETLRKEMPQATERVIDDFLRVLAKASPLQIPSHLVRRNVRFQMVQVEDIDRLFDATKNLGLSWESFYKAYPDAAGLVRISRAGIDEAASQALFFMSLSYGGLRGTGYFVLLHRPLGVWRVLATEQAWIS
ncbi:hypothetical protein SAMN05518845_114172 [Variovorax sp. YR750]|uniref:hypothetical protein n=1 Tax=Variovorax sp. YR750 TaxID=1884384 RepID=UPI0008AB6A0A|nr:hypothetical protein [Variovorax sp. YR750]SEM00665.1 hypothetical protein SAMN05518845_114172 [Variovorax sp. YR750]